MRNDPITEKRKRSLLVASLSSSIKPSVAAAAFLVAIEIAQDFDGRLPLSASEALEMTGASRSQAYEMRKRLCEQLSKLHQPAGRPVIDEPASQQTLVVAKAVRDFVMFHPGSVRTRGSRCTYGESFQRFVVGLFGPSGVARDLPVEQAADAIGVPLGTLKDWLRVPTPDTKNEVVSADLPVGIIPVMSCTHPEIVTLIAEYEAWEGSLSSFCDYARDQLRLAFGRSFITHVLIAAGLHCPSRRNKEHQAPWSRGSMYAPFPGMQWFGDGKQLTIILRDQRFTFNLEAMVDGASNAVVGARITDAEDSLAVIQSFHEGMETTSGQPPLAVTLDNRPSNFAPAIQDALTSTELLRSTPGRGQAKAPVEGSFGLFEQSLPSPIIIGGQNDKNTARSIAQQIATAFFRGRNGRPRGKLGGLTPSQSYKQSKPSQEQIAQAKKHILELRRREQLARQTREQRADPIRRQLLNEQLKLLEIDDPAGEQAISLCGYSMSAIVGGIAAYRAKKEGGTLPTDCDSYRYLGGIIRNIEASEYLERMARHLLELRLRAGDLQLIPLQIRADSLRDKQPASVAASRFVDEALDASSELAFRFWCSQAGQSLAGVDLKEAIVLFRTLARTISVACKASRKQRERLLRLLTAAIAPVAA